MNPTAAQLNECALCRSPWTLGEVVRKPNNVDYFSLPPRTHADTPVRRGAPLVAERKDSALGGGQKKEGQKGFGCMKEAQASHLASIKSGIFFSFLDTIYKTDGPKYCGDVV